MGFSRQEYWSGLPFPSPGDFPNPGIEPRSPVLQSDALTCEPPGNPNLAATFLHFFKTHALVPQLSSSQVLASKKNQKLVLYCHLLANKKAPNYQPIEQLEPQ